MKFSFKIMAVLFCAMTYPLCAADEFYADYTEETPAEILQPVMDGDPALQKWQIRFADACALIMGEDQTKHAEARMLLYKLLDEQPDSREVLNLLSVIFEADPACRKEIREQVSLLVKKHTRSIPLNMFVFDHITRDVWVTDFLKNALKFYTEEPNTIAAATNGMRHVRDVIFMSSVFCVEYQTPELAVLMNRCRSVKAWFDGVDLQLLQTQLNILHSLTVYPLFYVALGKPEVLSFYNELRRRYLEMILKDGLDSLHTGDSRRPYCKLCADLLSDSPSRKTFIEKLEKSLQEQPGHAAKTELLAFLYAAEQQNDTAITLLQTYLKNAKEKDVGMILLGYELLTRAARWDDLLAFADEYSKYLPEEVGTGLRLEMLRTFLKNKDPLRAASALASMKTFQALSGRIQLLVQAQRFADAYTLLKEQALPRFAAGEKAANPQQELAFLMTASALTDLYKDFAATETLYLVWLKDHPDDPLVLNNLAYTYAVQNIKLDDACRMSAAALKADPGNAAFLDTMAWVLYRQKKYKEAAEVIEKAIAAFGEDIHEGLEALEHAGDIYFALGDNIQAKLYWLRTMKILKDMELKADIKKQTEIKRIQKKLDKLKETTENECAP